MKIVDVDQVFFLFPFSLFLARPHDSCHEGLAKNNEKMKNEKHKTNLIDINKIVETSDK